ncbi:hypothetical protein SPI02_14380 [Staphylococcus piscifermentans]|uniref:Uncharacterized protein n=1 Tax=Staphylococcus piscifermentans TaxID=70258 RepID=A0A512QN25_9STAP|nr:hypothetical protein SPI02_14380 [Staphylococcus piscifermentans]
MSFCALNFLVCKNSFLNYYFSRLLFKVEKIDLVLNRKKCIIHEFLIKFQPVY